MKRHMFHFFILFVLLSVGTGAFFLADGNRQLQLFIGTMTSLTYVVWGMLHHAIQSDLHPKVVIEYVLIGVIAVVLLILLLGA